MLALRGRKINLLLVRGRSPGVLVHKGSRATTIRVRYELGLQVKIGRWCATIANNPDICEGIAPKDRDPRFLGQLSLNQLRDMRRYSLFLHTLV